MALKNNDLFVVQSQDDSKLYSLKLQDLITEVEGGAGVNFRGAADLNNPPATSGINLPAPNGDMYVVESDAGTIDAGWAMQNSETSANKGDRIIFDGDNNNWLLITSGSSTAGTVTDITATTPLQSDNDPVNPVLTVDDASTTQKGVVARLATNDDVKHTDGTGANTAVVTADLLKATNDVVEGLATAAGGVQTITTTDANGNSALSISPTSGNAKIEINTADAAAFGVVQLASASDITDGTSGATAVVDAAQLQAVANSIPNEGIQSIAEGGADTEAGALVVETTGTAVAIGVKEETFCTFDFSSLTDITSV